MTVVVVVVVVVTIVVVVVMTSLPGNAYMGRQTDSTIKAICNALSGQLVSQI